MDYITYNDLGPYLSTNDQKQIVLKRNAMPVFPLYFEDEQLARQIILQINQLYGSDLEYLGWVDWLSDIRQIHQARKDRFKFGDFVTHLLALGKYITIEDCVECWKRAGGD